MQVVFEIERLKQPKELENIYVFDDGIVKAVVKVEEIDGMVKISEFFVDTFFQGNGIGTKILRTIVEKNSKDLFLYVLDKNERSVKFYENFGFKYSGVKGEYANSGFYMLKYVFENKKTV